MAALLSTRILLLALILGVCWAYPNNKNTKQALNDCEKSCGNYLTADQKARLCAGAVGADPCSCAAAAKTLHLSGEDIVSLCHNSVNASPADCLLQLPNQFRKRYGLPLCTNATSVLHGNCFKSLTESPFRGVHTLDHEEVLDFCRQIEDAGPLACVQAIPEAGLGNNMPAKLGLLPTACRQTTLFVYPAGTLRNTTTGKPVQMRDTYSLPRLLLDTLTFWRAGPSSSATAGYIDDVAAKKLAILACLEELKHTFSASTLKADRFGAQAILEFCMHSTTRTMSPDSILPENLFFGERLERIEQTKRHQAPEYFRNYLSECAIRIGHIMTPGTTRQVFTAEQRLRMCEGIDSPNGPFNCAASIINVGSTEKENLTPDQIVQLCSAAGGIDRDAAVELRADAKKEEIRVKKLRSRSKQEREWAEKAKRTLLVTSYRRLGLGPALCFIESRSIGLSLEERLELCAGAEGVGPATCYKKAASTLRLASHAEKLVLCVGADSSDPADCAQSGPHYLTMPERIHLCMGAPKDRGMEPVRCLQTIESPSRLLKGAPKRGIGSFSAHLRTPEESVSRSVLLHMCSFDGSKFPLASAECLKSAPPALLHDNVARTCTNTSTADLFSRVALCQRLLPQDWTLDETAKLCGFANVVDVEDAFEAEANAKAEAEVAAEEGRPVREAPKKELLQPTAEENRASSAAVVFCALDMLGHQTYRSIGQARDGTPSENAQASIGSWSRKEASLLCRRELANGAVRQCAREALPSPSASAAVNVQFINPATITDVCHKAVSSATSQFGKESKDHILHAKKAGQCLSHLASAASRIGTFAVGVAENICTSPDPNFIITCLQQGVKNQATRLELSHVRDCLSQPRAVERAQFAQLWAIDGAPFITAGLRFSIVFDLIDQYGISFYDGTNLLGTAGNAAASTRTAKGVKSNLGCQSSSIESDKLSVQISINEGNEQGAVLWGSRTNRTSCGSIVYSNLILTQPGPVIIKLTSSLRKMDDTDLPSTIPAKKTLNIATLAVMTLNVRINPESDGDTGRCLFLFKEGLCDSNEALNSAKRGRDEEELDGTGQSISGGSHSRMYFPVSSQHYLKFLSCSSTFDKWHITWHAYAYGFWADYRNGVDSIWTGRQMPRDDMPFTEILGLPADILSKAVSSTNALKGGSEDKQQLGPGELKKRTGKVSKIIRRAYYRKSLQWHPDRWVGMSLYSATVQTAFEAVTWAHDRLQKMLEIQLNEKEKEPEESIIPEGKKA